MGEFRNQLSLPNGQWYPKIKTDKKTIYSTTSTEWTLLNNGFREKNL